MFKLHVEREIACSHKLNLHDGKCNNLHGHNYKVVVDIKSNILRNGDISDDGMLVDFGFIKGVIDDLDHKHLNDYFEVKAKNLENSRGGLYNLCRDCAIQPTTERLCRFIASELNIWDRCGIRVRIYESSSNYAEYSEDYYNNWN